MKTTISQLGWLIDPEERLILAFIPGQEPMELTGGDRLWRAEHRRLPIAKFFTLDLTVEQVFDWLKAGR
ncbi:hypothetical protein [Anabaena sp. CCY 0017]|uniref:hypothetical protein n=1 Tax=Anabaena sp. CCY 0017 TaxID=3103866 RepID=UPI0039C63383